MNTFVFVGPVFRVMGVDHIETVYSVFSYSVIAPCYVFEASRKVRICNVVLLRLHRAHAKNNVNGNFQMSID